MPKDESSSASSFASVKVWADVISLPGTIVPSEQVKPGKQVSAWFGRRRIRTAQVLYVIWSLVTAVFAIVRSVMNSSGHWPHISRLMPLAVLASPGSWLLVLPLASLGAAHLQEPFVQSLAAAAILPPALTSQMLVCVIAVAEFGDNSRSNGCAEFISVICGLIQFCLLLAASAAQVQRCRFPVPLALGASLAVGEAAGSFIAYLSMSGEDFAPHSHGFLLCLAPVSLLLVGAAAQVLWSALAESLSQQQEHVHASEKMTRTIKKLNTKLLLQEETASRILPGGEVIMTSRFDESLDDINCLWESLKQTELSQEAIADFGAILRRIKASLTSTNLFRTEFRRADSSGSHSRTSSRIGWRLGEAGDNPNVRNVQQMCERLHVQIVRAERNSPSVSISEESLPGSIVSFGPGPGRPSRPRSISDTSCLLGEQPQLSLVSDINLPARSQSGRSICSDHDFKAMPSTHATAVAQLGKWNFNVHTFAGLTQGRCLLGTGLHYGPELLLEAGFDPLSRTLRGFLETIESLYQDVPYHNAAHAADVVNSTMYFLAQDRKVSLTPLEAVPRLAAFMAAIIHDVGHMGRGNRFHVASHDPIAVMYNDQSPLESMHCAIGFMVIQQPHSALLCPRSSGREDISLSTSSLRDGGGTHPQSDGFTMLRRIVVEAVLATDMTRHFEIFSRFKAAINFSDRPETTNLDSLLEQALDHRCDASLYSESPVERAVKVVAVYLKAADVGHAAKLLDITKQMTLRIHREFFVQGDEERELGLPISPLCDRSQVNIAASQVGFLRHLVIPLYQAVHFYLPSETLKHDCLDQLEANILHWQSPTPCVTVADVPPGLTGGDVHNHLHAGSKPQVYLDPMRAMLAMLREMLSTPGCHHAD